VIPVPRPLVSDSLLFSPRMTECNELQGAKQMNESVIFILITNDNVSISLSLISSSLKNIN
jgi:hypothetical protein